MSLPTIVVVHNRYLEPGGEDTVFDRETALLERRGHAVVRVEVSNDAVAAMSKPRLAATLLWSRGGARLIRDAVADSGAGVVHFHNTLPLVSPSAYHAARGAGAAVVQTLHNYRLICPGGQLMRDGRPCEVCVGSPVAWRGVVHACYRDSRVESAGVATMVAAHRAIGTWARQVDAYIALTPFARDRFVAGGLQADRIHVRPNFLDRDPGAGEHRGDHALFVGRLTAQKGVRTLVEAWRRLGGRVPLRIVGDGELDAAAAGDVPGVEWVGRLDHDAVLAEMRGARALVLPSLSYENFPVTVVEAYATGLPVIASRIGGLPGIVRDGVTGLTFEPGSPDALAATVAEAWQNPAALRRMGVAGRQEYERSYSAEPAYRSLRAVYEEARRRFERSRNV